jgi:hypothetical protein
MPLSLSTLKAIRERLAQHPEDNNRHLILALQYDINKREQAKAQLWHYEDEIIDPASESEEIEWSS